MSSCVGGVTAGPSDGEIFKSGEAVVEMGEAVVEMATGMRAIVTRSTR